MKLKTLLLTFLLLTVLSASFVNVAKATDEATGYFHNIWILIVKGEQDFLDPMILHDVLEEQYPNNTKHRYLGIQQSHPEYVDPRVDDGNPLTKQVLNDTIRNWLGQAEDDDLIFIYVCSHGDTDGEHEFFVLNNKYGHYYVYDYEFNQMLSGLHYKTMVIAMQTCYSGGFIEDLTAPGRVIVTACNKTTVAKGFYVHYNSNPYFKANFTFVDRFNHTEPTFPEVDADGNGKVSIKEAFVFAYVNDLARINGKETPQLYHFGLAGTTFLEQPKICELTIWASYGGTTDPIPGKHYYFLGTDVTVTAVPTVADWKFDCWILDGSLVYHPVTLETNINPITVTMDFDHDLTAYFIPEDEQAGGGDTCPTLFVWSGTEYVYEGLLDIHNPSGEDVVREVLVQAEDVGVSNHRATFRLREGWLGLNFSESVIDQVKLYAIDEDGKLKQCPLTSATHSRLGDVHEYLALSDDVKVQILLLETIELTFKVRKDSQGFIFVIEGCNKFKM